MKPHEREDRAADRARKLFVFAGGFPVEGGWLAPPWSTPAPLPPTELNRAERALTALPRDEAKGLGRLIARMRAGRIEPFAAEDGFSREARRLAASMDRRMAPLLEAVAWATLPRPSEALRWLRLIEASSGEYVALLRDDPEGAVRVLFKLRALHEETRESHPFLRDLVDRRLRAHPFVGGAARAQAAGVAIRRMIDSLEPVAPVAAAPLPYARLVHWLGQLERLSASERRDALRIYALSSAADAAAEQVAAWSRLDVVERAVAHVTPRRWTLTEDERERLEALHAETQALAKAWPGDLNVVSWLEAILLAARRPGAGSLIDRAMRRLDPPPGPQRMLWIECACRAAALPDDPEDGDLHWPRIEPLLAAVPEGLSAKVAPRAMNLVFGDVVPRAYTPLGGHRWKDIPARLAWGASILAAKAGEPSPRDIRTLPAATEIAEDAALAVALVRALDGTPDLEPAETRAALRALPGGLDRAKDVVERVKKLGEGKDLEAAIHAFAARRRTGDVRELLIEGHGKALIAAGKLVRFVDARRARRLIPSLAGPRRPPAWAARYPAALQPALGRLSVAAGDEAGEIAGRFLRELLAAGDRPARLASPVRLANLAGKIDAAARRATLERWRSELATEARRGLAEGLGVPAIPADWIDASPRRLECFAQAMKLPAESRRMARRVLARRLGPPPWDLREEPHNAEVIARLEARGLDLGPWLDGIPPLDGKAPGGAVQLAFEPDPLELLEMGAYFGTCLSPGQCNYFSVFANLLDMNKRVIYARDASRKVVARCLLGLTAQGGIVTFHAYRHANWGFEDLVRDFVAELARRMHTVVLARGDVPRLAAHDWYDDGPVDLTGRLGCFADGSAFRAGLARVDAAELGSFLRRELTAAGLALDELTFPLVVALDEANRPTLAVAFAELALGIPLLPSVTLEKVLGMVAAGEAKQRVIRVLGERVLEAARRANDSCPDDLWSIGSAHPSATLAFLRATHAAGVRSIEAEFRTERLGAAAEALFTLRRPRQAERLYKKLLAGAPAKLFADLARARLAELETS